MIQRSTGKHTHYLLADGTLSPGWSLTCSAGEVCSFCQAPSFQTAYGRLRAFSGYVSTIELSLPKNGLLYLRGCCVGSHNEKNPTAYELSVNDIA